VIAKTQQRAMKIERHESEAIAQRKCAILNIPTLLEKGIKISILSDSCGHIQNKTMIGMLNGWKIGRILLRKNIGLLK
jgi:hypothetical protein